MINKPNVLILLTDEQRYDTINNAGYSHMVTPSLDRLSEEGVLYEYAHTSNPICMPARHDLITGLPGKAHGYYSNSGDPIKDYGLPTLPRIFSENGYRTAAVGKMHFKPPRMHHGFNEMFLMEELPNRRQDDQYATFLKEQGLDDVQNIHGIRPLLYFVPQISQMEEKYHGNTWVADKTIEWLDNNGDNPFFLFSSWISPHPPFALPEDFCDIYKNKELPDPIPVSRSELCPKEGDEFYGDYESQEIINKMRAGYFGAISMVDKNIGRIIDFLEENNRLEDTLIIFTSDHGEMLYDKGYYKKGVPYESSVRIPMIIRYPEKFSRDVVNEELVNLFDILPTCLDVCDLDYDGDKFQLPGRSLADTNRKKRKYQISTNGEGVSRWVMVKDKKYKYVYRYYNQIEEFYDLENDPGELKNLMKTGNYSKEIYRELKRESIKYERKWSPEENIKNGELRKYSPGKSINSPGVKYPMGLNHQFQYFDESGKSGRGKQFLKEVKHALKNPEIYGMEPGDIFNNEEFVKDFEKKYKDFADKSDAVKNFLFNENQD